MSEKITAQDKRDAILQVCAFMRDYDATQFIKTAPKEIIDRISSVEVMADAFVYMYKEEISKKIGGIPTVLHWGEPVSLYSVKKFIQKI